MLRVIGAGLPRTGTNSLKAALTTLLGAPCYHMFVLFERLDDVPRWQRAVDTGTTDWDALFDGYAAAVDWPASAFWPQLADRYPDAVIVLSTRTDAATWWDSVANTILPGIVNVPDAPGLIPWHTMLTGLHSLQGTDSFADRNTAMAYYDRHVANVRATAPPGRLVDWQAPQGWEPLCAALGLPVPEEPFPHLNSTTEFRTRVEKGEKSR